MAGYVQTLKKEYAFESIGVRIMWLMRQLADDAQALEGQIEALRAQLADLEALRSSKLADFQRIKENHQSEELKWIALSAEYGERADKSQARAMLKALRRGSGPSGHVLGPTRPDPPPEAAGDGRDAPA